MGREASIANNTLKIESTNGYDFCHAHELADFAETLQHCTKPGPGRDATATIGLHKYLRHLPCYFPSKIEHLRSSDNQFWLSMSSWLRCAGLLRGYQSENHLSFRLDVFGGVYGERSTSH